MDAFIGEIRLMAFDFPPKNWTPCDGRLLPINTNSALYALLGTAYGGDGRTNFGLPDLRGRVAVSSGYAPGLQPYLQGQMTGTETVTLTTATMPAHTHLVSASAATASTGTSGSQPSTGVTLAQAYLTSAGNQVAVNRYASSGNTTMAPSALETTGASQPHNNMQPFLVMNYCIATVGYYPSRQ